MADTLAFHSVGSGLARVLLHGLAEDAGMLEAQAHAFADRGCRAVWYDRRGTGSTARGDWPNGDVVAQHADDAAAIVRSLGGTAQVWGFGTGGIVAMELARRHPSLRLDVIAWEPPAIGVLSGGAFMHQAFMAPSEDFLVAHPGDWAGAYLKLVETISGGAADLASTAVLSQLRNAEPAVRDDARIMTRHAFPPATLPADRVRVAVSRGVNDLHARIAAKLVDDHHVEAIVVESAENQEVYRHAPEVLAEMGWRS